MQLLQSKQAVVEGLNSSGQRSSYGTIAIGWVMVRTDWSRMNTGFIPTVVGERHLAIVVNVVLPHDHLPLVRTHRPPAKDKRGVPGSV